MKRQQQRLALCLFGILSASEALSFGRHAHPIKKRGLVDDILDVITGGPDPAAGATVTVTATVTALATITVGAPEVAAAAALNDTAAAVDTAVVAAPAVDTAVAAAPAVAETAAGAVLGAAAPAAVTVTQTVMVMQSCPVVGAAAAPAIDTAAAAVGSVAPAVAAGVPDAAVTGPHGGVGVAIVSLAQTAVTTTFRNGENLSAPGGAPAAEATSAVAVAPPAPEVGTLQPLPGAAATVAPVGGLQPLPGSGSGAAAAASPLATLAPLPGLASSGAAAAAPAAGTLLPLPGAASPNAVGSLQPLPGLATPAPELAPTPLAPLESSIALSIAPVGEVTPEAVATPDAAGSFGQGPIGQGAQGGMVGVMPTAAAATAGAAGEPSIGSDAIGGAIGFIPAAGAAVPDPVADPAAAVTPAPDGAVATAPLDINLSGLSLNSVLNLGNLVQQTISLQTPTPTPS